MSSVIPDGEQRFRSLAVATAVLTYLLILIGIYTATAGFGLTCEARWPVCDGAVFGLFPANWGSFVEWFHRLVAMVTGFAILGLAGAAWRGGRSRRVRYATAAAALVLPSQILLGALTVTQYELLILAAHFTTALLIFLPVTAVAVWSLAGSDAVDARRLATVAAVPPVALALFVAGATQALDGASVVRTAVPLAAFALATGLAVRTLADGSNRSRAGTALGGALPLLLLAGALTPGVAVASLPATVAYYAASLAALAALFAAALWLADGEAPEPLRRVRALVAGAVLALALQLLLSRVWPIPDTDAVVLALDLTVLAAAAVAFWWNARLARADPPGGRPAGGD
jgi:cytochrome c oxidase assembly protein subunit 15